MATLAIRGGKPLREQPFPSWPVSGPLERELLDQVLASESWGGYSELVGRFEQLFAALHSCDFGIATANGSVAIEVALQAAGIGAGDEVIVPAHSFIATASSVARVGGVPVFADILPDTYNLDYRKLKTALSEKTKAVIVVHFGGVLADMDRIGDLARNRKILVLEDAAHAHGAEWHGQRAGSMGLAGTFSFQNSKPMTAGEGGIVVTNDTGFAERARSFVNCGRREGRGWFEHFELATNYRMSGFQAAVLLAQLERLPEQVRARAENLKVIQESLAAPGLYFQTAPAGANVQTLYLLVGRVDEDVFGIGRDEFVAALEAEGIPCRPFYPHPLYANALFRNVPHRVEPCPVAERACKDSFWLPQRVLMGSKEDALDITRAIAKIYDVVKPKPKKSTAKGVNGSAKAS
ncbi:MAG: DegT/DnrJ/EryC1/StrS family aminotransferase [Bryobacterales bacterium]